MAKLIITVGPTSCGKSTFARKWMKEATGRYALDADLMRCALNGGQYVYDPVNIEPVLLPTLTSAAFHYLERGYDVLVDDAVLFLKHQQRMDFFRNTYRGLTSDQRVVLMFPAITVREAVIRRARGGLRGISPEKWGEIFERHMKELEVPTDNEFYKVEYVKEEQI